MAESRPSGPRQISRVGATPDQGSQGLGPRVTLGSPEVMQIVQSKLLGLHFSHLQIGQEKPSSFSVGSESFAAPTSSGQRQRKSVFSSTGGRVLRKTHLPPARPSASAISCSLVWQMSMTAMCLSTGHAGVRLASGSLRLSGRAPA